jgi:hypothetical protein
VNKTGERHFNLLTGTPSVRKALEGDIGLFVDGIKTFTQVGDWVEKTRGFYLYK